jgi:hypothetical protein
MCQLLKIFSTNTTKACYTLHRATTSRYTNAGAEGASELRPRPELLAIKSSVKNRKG